jgi:hypothetical protein
MGAVEVISIATGIASMVLAVFAMWFAMYCYDKSKTTDQSITNSLAKIEAQADSLQRLSGKFMDRLTRYVTTDRPPGPVDQQLIAVLTQLPQMITMRITQPQSSDPPEHLIDELITCYIIMCHYMALTNFWAAGYLPDAAEFDETNEFQLLTRRIVETSYQDFGHMARLLGAVDQRRLERNPSANILIETRDRWGHLVRSVADIWAQRARQGA